MKVKELIAKLQEFDGEFIVSVPLQVEVNGERTLRNLFVLDVITTYNQYGFSRDQVQKVLLISE